MMKFLSFIGSSVFQAVSILFVLGYLLGVLNIHFSDKNDYCQMTYMFEYPQFVRVTVPESQIYPQYGLYAYSEGRFTERARKMWFDGIPVLFLPGNSGSHMQARSLASVALRKALTGPYEYHFDYFTIGYNEELSGLYGGVLESQTKFASTCISKILSLYKSNRYTKSVPTSVILIGHSMGGVVAKRLLAYQSTINTTTIALTLAAPLEAPVVNFDSAMNDYYSLMNQEWTEMNKIKKLMERKLLLSIGNGPRDILMPSGLTFSQHSYINALTTAIPGVWVSPDHVGIVWCKQLVMTINKYLFGIVDLLTEQITEDRQVLTMKARQYFQANRSMTLSSHINRPNVTMVADAFWYEDNRRIYQISRPDIDKITYLMIRLVNFPQNRFVAIESVNVTDKDWIFGCNAAFVHNTHRYCKQATSLTELSRWTGAATGFGRRKLATIHLHHIKQFEPEWTHVVVKLSPTRKPVILNVDINDLASRQITVDLPALYSFGAQVIKQESEPNSLYYELIFPGFTSVDQAYLLHVEPTSGCKASQYQVSAEVHVPWAKNNEYYHYFTHLKRSPLKLRLYQSNPNVSRGLDSIEHVKVTLLLDPQCTFTISISSTIYHRLAQIARNYTPVLVPYVAAIILLAARSNILHLKKHGTCMNIHRALLSDDVKPFYVLVCSRLGFMVLMSVPFLTYIFENASWHNPEIIQFSRSFLVVGAYMCALGLLHIAAAVLLAFMLFSSQLAHRLLFRIMWRGGAGIAEKVASGLQNAPLIVNVALLTGIPLSCGAASLLAGAAFYAFMKSFYTIPLTFQSLIIFACHSVPLGMGALQYAYMIGQISKMYEEYLEDYVYKLMAKVSARICKLFTKKKQRVESQTSLVFKDDSDDKLSDLKALENKEIIKDIVKVDDEEEENNIRKEEIVPKNVESREKERRGNKKRRDSGDIDENLNNLNFQVMMFFMWMCVTLINVPALLTWARNFKYGMVLKLDTSYNIGLMMSVCSSCLWQLSGPRKNLEHYDLVAALLFVTAVCILVLGPFTLNVVNWGITLMYTIMTLQQMFDIEIIELTSTVGEENYEKSHNNIGTEMSQNLSIEPNASGDAKDANKNTSAESSQSSKNRENIQKNNIAYETEKSENISQEPNASGDAKVANKNTSAESSQSSDNTSENRENIQKQESESSDCVCSEKRIYAMFKSLREKLDFSSED